MTPHVVPEIFLLRMSWDPRTTLESGHRIVNTGNSMSDDVLRRAHELASSSGPEEDEHAELVSRLDDLLDTRVDRLPFCSSCFRPYLARTNHRLLHARYVVNVGENISFLILLLGGLYLHCQ